jgi:hypothetical protein
VKLSLALLGGIGIAVLIGLFEASGHDHHEHEFSSVQTHERWLGPTRKLVGSAAKNAPGRFDFTPRPGL